jgi:hypothetical protein
MKCNVRFIVCGTDKVYDMLVFVPPMEGDMVILYESKYKVIGRTFNFDNGKITIYIENYGNC